MLLATLFPAVFLAVDPAGWYPFGPAKWMAVSALIPAGLATLIWRDRGLRIARPAGVASVALVAAFAVAAAVGLDGRYAWLGTPERHLGVVAWLLCASAMWAGATLDTGRDAPIVVRGAVVAGMGVGAVAVAELLGVEARWLGAGSDRLAATLGSPAYLGAAAAVALPIGIGVALTSTWASRWRVAGAVSAAFTVVALIGSGSRGAWLGAIAAGVVVAASRFRGVGELGAGAMSGAKRIGLLAVGGLVVVATVVGLANTTPVGDRIASLGDPNAPGGQARVDEWRVAARVIAERPILGTGPEGYRLAFAGSVDEAYERQHGRTPLPDRAHSGPLDVAATGGVVALTAWLAVWALFARAVWRVLRRPPEPWLVGVAAALVAHFVGQLVLFPTAEVESAVWLLAGVLVGATARPYEMRWASIGRPGATFSAGLLAVIAGITVVLGVSDLVADRDARRSADALAAGRVDEALARARSAADRRPDVLRYHLLTARTEVAAGEGLLRALESVDRALEISPRDPVARRERVRLLALRAEATQVPAHAAEVVAAAEDLVTNDPNGADAWILLAEARRLNGQVDEARDALGRADHLAPADPRVEAIEALLDEAR